MIKTQDLKLQMDELTKQNDMVLIELESVKKMLISSAQGSQDNQSQGQSANSGNTGNTGQEASGQQSNQGQGQDQQQAQQGQGQEQNQDQAQTQGKGQNQGQGQGQDQNQNQNQNMKSGQGNSNNNQQVTDLANELLKIKDLVVKLEQKTSQYVSSQSNGSLTEKDAVNLILTLMNGMVDWASEFVSSKASSNGQVQ
ncbi:hypothetical protein A8709_23960 [Paenibacillus pectinilyticus]|uniref:Uncharacterized protein n=1 Tax=Paenibacillus pectinilyticus TaxID=512399 RepID=A0A1C1A8W8_9BACL|nr:hypothetical protein [Paenibacillus pectinilyticus]OCT17049.1 hypothetical protein A8709_23960 [Paenibacillus pectinilyticus]